MSYNYIENNLGIFEGLFAGLAISIAVIALIVLISGILVIVAKWKLLEKGNKPGWGALIPVYNTYLFCELVGINPYWILIVLLSPVLNIIPILGSLFVFGITIYFNILLNVSIAKSFNKDSGFAIGLILLPIVFYPILAFSKDTKYVGPQSMEDILFDMILKKNNKNSDIKYCTSFGNQITSNDKYCPNCGKEISNN